ncbi:sigma factor-like helix-turn-helix DNA-binding protein [Streptomyces sp. NPDC020917]|uniref:sigma factor-like helix-turn-helix DNA-binding protein n=1 Tax=Streptomyces sp. NPDC020917 TaxID=3365102 RepID=UPI00378BF8C0
MGRRRAAADSRRDAEFAAFTAGAGGRLLHSATLLTGDPAAAERLLTTVLAQVYADWFRMRAEDPYEQARSEMVRRFHHRPWWRRPHGGELDRLSGRERLVITLRFFEGVAEEQTAAQLGLPADRVRAICARATATLRSRPDPRLAGAEPAGSPAARSRSAADSRDRSGDPAAIPGAGKPDRSGGSPDAARDPAVAAPAGARRSEGTP